MNRDKVQSEALEALLKYDNGILQAATAFGKTVVGAKLISEISVILRSMNMAFIGLSQHRLESHLIGLI